SNLASRFLLVGVTSLREGCKHGTGAFDVHRARRGARPSDGIARRTEGSSPVLQGLQCRRGSISAAACRHDVSRCYWPVETATGEAGLHKCVARVVRISGRHSRPLAAARARGRGVSLTEPCAQRRTSTLVTAISNRRSQLSLPLWKMTASWPCRALSSAGRGCRINFRLAAGGLDVIHITAFPPYGQPLLWLTAGHGYGVN